MQRLSTLSPQQFSLNSSDKKYLDDYETRLEQAESGIRDLTINLAQHLFEEDGGRLRTNDLTVPCSSPPIMKSLVQRDSRVYSRFDNKTKNRFPTCSSNSSSRRRSTTPRFVHFAPIEREVCDDSAPWPESIKTNESNVCASNSHERHSPKKIDSHRNSALDHVGSKIDHHPPSPLRSDLNKISVQDDSTPSYASPQHELSQTKLHSHGDYYPPVSKPQNGLSDSSPQHILPDTAKSAPCLSLRAPFMKDDLTKVEPVCYSKRFIQRDAEQYIVEKTEEIQRRMNLQLQMYKEKIDEEFEKKIKVIRQEVLAEKAQENAESFHEREKQRHLNSEMLGWRTKYEDLLHRYEDLSRDMAMYKKKCERLDSTVYQSQQECHNLQSQLTRIKNQAEQNELKHIHQKGCIERLECDLENALSAKKAELKENKDLERKINALDQKKNYVERELTTLKESYKNVEQNLSSTQSILRATQIKLDESCSLAGKLQMKVKELQEEIQQRRESESFYAAEVEKLKSKEYNLQQQIRSLLQKCEENSEWAEKHLTLTHQHEQITHKMNLLMEELGEANAQIKLLTSQKEKLAVDLRSSTNDNLLLTQENVKLRKEKKEMQLRDEHCPIPNDPVVFFHSKPASGVDKQLCDLRVFQRQTFEEIDGSPKPPNASTKKLSSNEFSSYLDGEKQKTDENKLAFTTVPQQKTEPFFVNSSNDPNECPYNRFTTEGLEKQLTLLEMQKNEIQSHMARLPGSQNGSRSEERSARIELERTLQNVEANIQKTRQAIRFSNGSKRNARYTYF